MFERWQHPAGQYLWFDVVFLLLQLVTAVGLIVFTIRRYRLQFPPFRPLALIGLGYWLTAMIFSDLHQLVWYFNNDAYSGLKNKTNFEFVYFSFVTLTTLGFGDIYPVSYMARWLSIVEACVGLFFIAILIAILTGRKDRDS